MRRPIIGVVPLWDAVKESIWMVPGYMDGIRRTDALPVILPLADDDTVIRDMAERFDGFLFTGGQDVSPTLYGGKTDRNSGEICPLRDRMETALFHAALEADKPAFGICRGIQLFNVLLGGSLHQDIPSEFPSGVCHLQKPPYDRPVHEVSVYGALRDLLSADKIRVNSYHHQGINVLSPKLTALAKSPDGLVEAVYLPVKRFVWAVQWHPEFMASAGSTRRLFAAFVDACRK